MSIVPQTGDCVRKGGSLSGCDQALWETGERPAVSHLVEQVKDSAAPEFAFAIRDKARRGLFLGRDPYGIKPLYTANDGWIFRFASQVKALLSGGHVSRDPEPAGIVGFHLFDSAPATFALYCDVRPLPAGQTQWVDAAGPSEPKPAQVSPRPCSAFRLRTA